jgi:glycine/D-amino acid oxidase-like deaminating enzyme
VTGPAGAIWPYRFVTAVLEHLVAQHGKRFFLETNTPVTAITTTAGNACERRFEVHTTRGTVRARHVVHCTNAHVGHLVPGLRGSLYPVRGQMSAQMPSPKFPHQGDDRSWIFAYEKGFDYLTQLLMDVLSSGEMMLGGGFVQSEDGGVEDVGIASDDRMSRCVEVHLSRTLEDVFGDQHWGVADQKEVKQMWTGTMGFSADGLPWVGKIAEGVHGRGAEWVAAGFSGEGMVQAWLCGKALVSMLMEHDRGERQPSGPAWFSTRMIVTEERICRSRLLKYVKPCSS